MGRTRLQHLLCDIASMHLSIGVLLEGYDCMENKTAIKVVHDEMDELLSRSANIIHGHNEAGDTA